MSEEEHPWILCLPDECLRRVFQFVDFPSRLNVSLVCQRFYEAICELEKDKNPIEISYNQICEDDIFRSITASKRKVRNLTLDFKGCRIVSNLSRIEKVVATFGDRIKQFKIWSSIQSEYTKLTDNHLIALLKLIPRVEELFLCNVSITTTSDESRLSLHDTDLRKLKKLSLDYCCFDSSFVLDSIPQDILTELIFTFDSSDETLFQNFFNRQSNIKKLEIFENDSINFDHLQLEHLKMSSSHNFVSVINNQPNLRFLDFAISWIDDDVFSAVCQLKHLEVFRTLIDQVSFKSFKSLRALLELKELRIDSHSSYENNHLIELSLMKCLHQLNKLTVLQGSRKISDETIIQMGQNLKSLRHIELINRSLKIVSIVLENFPLLQSILLDFFSIFGAPEDILEISDDFTHESLKQLVVTNVNVNQTENTISLLKLVNSCPNLERIMLSELQKFTTSDLNEIFNHHRNLSHLSLEFDEFEINEENIDVIKDFANKLDHLRLNGLYNFPAYAVLKAKFEIDFPTITLYKYSTSFGELIMKKRGIVDWHHNFKLLSHF